MARTITPTSMAMMVSTVSVQTGTGLVTVARMPGRRARKNPANEYAMLVAAIVTIDPISDSLIIATAVIRQKATNGASAPRTITGVRPPNTVDRAKMPMIVPAIAVQTTPKAVRLAIIFVAV